MSGKTSDALAEGVYEHLITERSRLASQRRRSSVSRMRSVKRTRTSPSPAISVSEIERVLASLRGEDRSSVRASFREAARSPRDARRCGCRCVHEQRPRRPRAACSRCTAAPCPCVRPRRSPPRRCSRASGRIRHWATSWPARSRRLTRSTRSSRSSPSAACERSTTHCTTSRVAPHPAPSAHHDLHRHDGGRGARDARAAARRRGPGLVRHAPHATPCEGMAVSPQHRADHRVRRLGEPDLDRARRRPGVDGQGLRRRPAARHRQVRGHVRHAVGDPEFEPYSPEIAVSEHGSQAALSAETSSARRRVPRHAPCPAVPAGDSRQARCRASRPRPTPEPRRRGDRHGQDRHRGARLRAPVRSAGVAPRLLFLAHRCELLDQARHTFRHALQDPSFGELLGGAQKPAQLGPRLREHPERGVEPDRTARRRLLPPRHRRRVPPRPGRLVSGRRPEACGPSSSSG